MNKSQLKLLKDEILDSFKSALLIDNTRGNDWAKPIFEREIVSITTFIESDIFGEDGTFEEAYPNVPAPKFEILNAYINQNPTLNLGSVTFNIDTICNDLTIYYNTRNDINNINQSDFDKSIDRQLYISQKENEVDWNVRLISSYQVSEIYKLLFRFAILNYMESIEGISADQLKTLKDAYIQIQYKLNKKESNFIKENFNLELMKKIYLEGSLKFFIKYFNLLKTFLLFTFNTIFNPEANNGRIISNFMALNDLNTDLEVIYHDRESNRIKDKLFKYISEEIVKSITFVLALSTLLISYYRYIFHFLYVTINLVTSLILKNIYPYRINSSLSMKGAKFIVDICLSILIFKYTGISYPILFPSYLSYVNILSLGLTYFSLSIICKVASKSITFTKKVLGKLYRFAFDPKVDSENSVYVDDEKFNHSLQNLNKIKAISDPMSKISSTEFLLPQGLKTALTKILMQFRIELKDEDFKKQLNIELSNLRKDLEKHPYYLSNLDIEIIKKYELSHKEQLTENDKSLIELIRNYEPAKEILNQYNLVNLSKINTNKIDKSTNEETNLDERKSSLKVA